MRCVLLHPHPDRGGNQHNKVISALFAALDEGIRFNFVSADLDVATGQVVAQLEGGPAWLVGYSFGGGIAALINDPRVLGWCLIAPALSLASPVIGHDSRSKYVVAAEHDTIFPLATIRAATADWTATTHDVIAGADHFLTGHETEVATRCATWLASASERGGVVRR